MRSDLLLLCLMCTALFSDSERLKIRPPLFFTMANEYDQVEKEEEVLLFSNADTTVEHELYLLSESTDRPLLYYSDITTPVCIDNLCKPMHIAIYWNLVGSYVGYAVFEANPLTKFDHDEFEDADLQKLHQLLLDDNSVLKRREMSDLFDANVQPAEQITYKGEEVDVISGATRKEIKNSVVEGALYSCYTIWHLVHGAVREQMKSYTAENFSDSLASYFLYSDYSDYQFYALKQMEKESFQEHIPQLIRILETASPLIRTYLLKKSPNDLWADPAVSKPLYQNFSDLDVNSKTLLISHLNDANSQAPVWLSNQVSSMSRNQLKAYLDYLKENPERLNESLYENLRSATQLTDYTYTYLIEEFLDN